MRLDKDAHSRFPLPFWALGLAAVVVAAGLTFYLWPRGQHPPDHTPPGQTSGDTPPRDKALAGSRVLQGDETPAEQLLFFPDGSHLVTVLKGGQLVDWDLADGQKTAGVKDDSLGKGAEIYSLRWQQRQERKQSRSLLGHVLAAAPAGLPALLPLCLTPEAVAVVCKQAESRQWLGLRHFGLAFASGPLPPPVILPALVLDAGKVLEADPAGTVGLQWGARSAPRIYHAVNGPDGPTVLEFVATEYRYPSLTTDDSDDPKGEAGKGGKQALVLSQLKLKAHTFKDHKAGCFDMTFTLDGWLLTGFGFSAEGGRLLLADKDSQLLLLENQAGDRGLSYELTVPGFKNADAKIEPLLLLADGKRALMADGDRTVGVWDLDGSRLVQTLDGLVAPVLGVAAGANGKRIVAWNRVQGVGVWDAATGTEVRRLAIPHDKLRLALSADGRRLLTDTEDRSLRLWDVETGKVLRELPYPEKPPTVLALSADGRQAAVASGNAIQVWELGH